MTISAVIGGQHWSDFATNRGHGKFIEWAERLDAGKYRLVVHLAEWGWVMGVRELTRQLRAAIEEVEPDPPLRLTLAGFLDELVAHNRGYASVLLTNGATADEAEGEWWIDGQPA